MKRDQRLRLLALHALALKFPGGRDLFRRVVGTLDDRFDAGRELTNREVLIGLEAHLTALVEEVRADRTIN